MLCIYIYIYIYMSVCVYIPILYIHICTYIRKHTYTNTVKNRRGICEFFLAPDICLIKELN